MVARCAAVLAILLAVAGCTARAPGHRTPAGAGGAPASSVPASAQVLGAAGCHPPSPQTATTFGPIPQVQGTGHGAQMWGLLMFSHPGPPRVGDQEKIVWRMTGSGLFTLTAISPSGVRHPPVQGPDLHSSSNWDMPGTEWGAIYVFNVPGCWDLHAARGSSYADVWIRVVRR